MTQTTKRESKPIKFDPTKAAVGDLIQVKNGVHDFVLLVTNVNPNEDPRETSVGGVIIHNVKVDSYYKVGFYSDFWNNSEISPFTGRVTLSND